MFDNIENCNSEILDVVIGCMLPNFDFQIDILEYLQFQLLSVSEPNIGRIFDGFLALYEQLRDPGNLSLVIYVSIYVFLCSCYWIKKEIRWRVLYYYIIKVAF